MVKHKRTRSTNASNANSDAEINALYGLEPVIEPGQHSSVEPTCFVEIGCPSCGERYAIEIDLTQGEFSQIEDCQVCCQPMQVSIELSERYQLRRVRTRRLDDTQGP
jgi:hypothetical protein